MNLNDLAAKVSQISRESADDLSNTLRSESWYRCRDQYIRDAVRMRDDDWTRFDDEATSKALLDIQGASSIEEVHRIIAGLIQHAATGHASVCERNGTLGD